MFGKDALASDQISEDEDWGPAIRKRRGKESDAASTLMTLCESEKKFPSENTTERKEMLPPSETTKQSLFRIPHIAVEVVGILFHTIKHSVEHMFLSLTNFLITECQLIISFLVFVPEASPCLC